MTGASQLHLSFEGTLLRVKQQQPPWRVVRGFRAASGETLAHLHNVSGGILDTDTLDWQVDVGPGALAQITSTGATRIHRSRGPGRIARQSAAIRVGAGGYLEYLPDQLIPFAESRFEQSVRVSLDPGASLIWWERVSPGREASGEVFRFASLASTFELFAGDDPVAIERWTLDPLARPLDSPGRLGPFRHFASCHVCRSGEPAAFWRKFEDELSPIAERLSSHEVLWAVSSLAAHGLIVRAAATSGRSLAEGMTEIWKAAKWSLCGRVATLPRKVH